jgi:TolA-binding protein
MGQIGDLWFRNQDFPGADIIADRLAALNPLAQIDEKSDIPPQAQMAIKQLQGQLQQAQQQMQQMQLLIKNRADVEQMKQEGETKRKLMDVTSRAHNTETMAEVKVNDQNTRAVTSQNKTEIDAIVQLLLHHMDTGRLVKEIEMRNAEQAKYAQEAASDIDQGQNPLMQQ